MKLKSIGKQALLGLSLNAFMLSVNAVELNVINKDISQQGGAKRLAESKKSQLSELLEKNQVKNVILLIGDGMGDSEITIARNYAEGAAGAFKGIDALPFSGHITTYALDKETKLIEQVTDSAASATAWTSGIKTYNGAIGVDVYGKPVINLAEIAKKLGKGTGNVTTAEIQDATPAALLAHISHRKCYGPSATAERCPESALENGGLGSITEQFLSNPPDVVFGGGRKTFDEKPNAGEFKDRTLWQQAVDKGFSLVNNAEDLNKLDKNNKFPILGLFSSGNMPVRWLGGQATFEGNHDNPITCQANPERDATIPNLAQMTEKAIELLKENPNGFFLQVEGASIDKQNHKANPCGQIGETVDLDEAVQSALEFARKDGQTLVIVTADHAHTSQLVPNKAKPAGLTQTLKAKDNSIMTISYGTGKEADEQQHTGSQLRIAAYGPKAYEFSGLLDQTDIFFIIKQALQGK
ncbi:alkaline phosphatase [Rodentibacter pneumotropicus]|uniref:alkaline phosphatase n=1 Tax=Rodentibacter pneumotropicus TaxID=758 RepID=UPI00037C16B1|nr:alkaline phosphatase [Rodentibacter pneumotropicus]NBH75906.1 alkaline phosphatase [Rodentibacter pneumotropicus]OOF62287.1 alkaline phosphatase [Rodentibacter pneumotropicus]THA04629.1 alkaline phosphatase [Rodentibacter pneumotropicus]THA06264.1 alkaline phosphatase [Rodentibacter pneumotropicus]THA12161.1 alkaline phosphatase [Rodentibacter pneumotropicus]